MLQEFQTHLVSLNYAWIIGAALFGIFTGLIFAGHAFGPRAFIFAGGIYLVFIIATMKLADAIHAFGYTQAFRRAASAWGATTWDLASACVAGLFVLIAGVFWALSR